MSGFAPTLVLLLASALSLWVLRRLPILWILWGRWMLRRWILGTPGRLCLRAQVVEFLVNGPLTKGKHAQYDQVRDRDKHEQAQRAAIARLGEDLPVNDREKDGHRQTDNQDNKKAA